MTLVCFPMRCEWDALHPAPPSTFPAPLVTSADPIPDAIPAPVASLARDMRRVGWQAEITHAHGHVPHAIHGRPSEKPKHSWAVRAWRGTQRAVAVREDAAWASLWDFSDVQFFRRSGTLEAFLTSVIGAMMCLPSGSEWDAEMVKYPLRPTRAQWDEMRRAVEALQ